jgi:threonine/homoserine/homoserine lactone efflux protein
MELFVLSAGVAIGLAMTAPPGPVNLLVIRTAIQQGFGTAFFTGFGAVVSDMIYATIAAYGVSSIAHVITSHARPLMAVGGALLVFIGVRLARTRLGLDPLSPAGSPDGRVIPGKVLTAFSMSITNPGVLFGFIAIFGTMNGVLHLSEHAGRPLVAVAGVAIGATAWWLFLSFFVSRLRERVSEAMFARINRWTGVLIAAFGFALLMEALF